MYVSNVQMRLVNRGVPNPKCCSDPNTLCGNCYANRSNYLPIPNTMEQIVNERHIELTRRVNNRDQDESEMNMRRIGLDAPLAVPRIDWKAERMKERSLI